VSKHEIEKQEKEKQGSANTYPAFAASNNPKKYLYVVFGIILFGLGVIGTVLPLLPTTPFMVLAAVCFGKSSEKLYTWCVSSKFYKKNIEGFVNKRTMTPKAKILLIASITLLMSTSFILLLVFAAPVYTKIILSIVWVLHVVYFGFVIKGEKV